VAGELGYFIPPSIRAGQHKTKNKSGNTSYKVNGGKRKLLEKSLNSISIKKGNLVFTEGLGG